jgi:protocatechuate 3,4-dioxygenase beta subunit
MSQVLDHDQVDYELEDHELEDHDRGLVFDLNTMNRRRVLKLLGFGGLSASLFTIVGCGPSGATGTPLASAAATAASVASGASCAVIPEETAGPFPGDGSNGPNVLSQDGVVRTDIRSSFGSSTTVAEGVPLAIKLTIQDAGGDCAPLAGAAVYLWHCDRDGGYSLYSQAVSDENYLRGVQEADDSGLVTFQSIFPACYSGRWTHIHFEVYPSLELAKDEGNRIATSQIALPKDACDLVYTTDGYSTMTGPIARRPEDRLARDHLQQERLSRPFRIKRRRKGRDGRVPLP